MSISRLRYILDASIAMKWLFNDEDNIEESLQILRTFQRGDINLLAPEHIYYEVLNSLKSGIIRNRVSEADARAAMEDFLALPITTVSGPTLLRNAFEIAVRYDTPYYDSLYLALADSEQCPLIHADRRLHNTLAGRFPREVWIEEYESHSERSS